MPQFITKNFIVDYEDSLEIEVLPVFNDMVVIVLREVPQENTLDEDFQS